MANDLHTTPETSVTQLVSGIVSDAQELIKQQLALFRTELKDDFRKTKEASILLAIGTVCAAVGAFLLLNMVVFVLHEAAGLSLWASYAIVGGLVAAVGAGLILTGLEKFKSFNPLPDQSVQALKENVQWITNPNPK